MRAAWSPFWRSRASSASRASRIQSLRILGRRSREDGQRDEPVTDEQLGTDEPRGLEPPFLAEAHDWSCRATGAADPAEQAHDELLRYGRVDRTLDRVKRVAAQELRVEARV